MLESWRMSKKAKLCKSFLLLTSSRRMIFALERVKQEKRLGLYCWINRKVGERLIPQDHTIDIQATKKFANVISNISTDNLEKGYLIRRMQVGKCYSHFQKKGKEINQFQINISNCPLKFPPRSLTLFFLFKIYSFIWEKERTCVHESGEGVVQR